MSDSAFRHPSPAQQGGITILVALMMLVLLTIAAVGMSRNSFRQIVTSGFSRQGAMARNAADSGVEWVVYWMDPRNGPAAAGNALEVPALMSWLNQPAQEGLLGQSIDLVSQAAYQPGGALQAGLTLSPAPGVTEGYTIGITNMGSTTLTATSQAGGGTGGGIFNPASGVMGQGGGSIAPHLWAVRSDSQVIQGSATFTEGVEAWITTPLVQQ